MVTVIKSYVTFQLGIFFFIINITCRSEWRRGLRHELPSLPRTLGSWVRIPLEAWMCVGAFILWLCCPLFR
jgi:hypothetical protein